MKFKNFIWIMAIGFGLTFGLTACSDDDDDIVDSSSSSTTDDDDTDAEETTTGYAAAVAGTYSGYADVMFSYITNPYAYPEETLTITAADDTTVDVAYENETWGTYAISGATVSDNGDGTYSIEGTGTATMAGHSGTSEYDATFTATIADGSSELVFSMPDVMGGTTVNFHEGTAPASYYAYGSYEGYTEMEFTYVTTPLGAAFQTVEVALNADDYSVVDVTYESDYGTFTVSAATATDNGDGTYTLEMVENGTLALDMSMSGHVISGDYDITSFTATISDDGSTFVFGMDFMSGTTATFYEGDSPAGYAVQGDWEGYDTASSTYFSSTIYTGTTISISATSQTTVDVTYTSETWGTATFESVEPTATDDGYTLSATSSVEMTSHSGSTSSYDCTLEATFDTEGNLLTFVVTIDVMGTTTLSFTEGDAPGAYAIAGEYTGSLALTMDETSLGSVDEETVTITASSETEATITLSAFSIEFGSMGTFDLDDITVSGVTISTEDDTTYTFAADGITVPVTFGETSMEVYGTLSGTVVKGDSTTVDLSFVLTVYGMEVTATFTNTTTTEE